MQVNKINFYNCKNLFDKKFDEIFLLKDSKLHFAIFGSNTKDGVVDGAKSKWKNIAFLDGLLTIAFNKCPEGFRTQKRSFDQYKCVTHCIKMSVIEDQSNTKIRKVYENIELYDFSYHFLSANNVNKLLLPDYRNSKKKLTRDLKKIMVIFTNQLKALLPKNFPINSELKDEDLLNHLIAKVDEQDLYFNAINKAIKISLEKEVDDFLVKHNNIIALRRNEMVLSNSTKSSISSKRRRSNSTDHDNDDDQNDIIDNNNYRDDDNYNDIINEDDQSEIIDNTNDHINDDNDDDHNDTIDDDHNNDVDNTVSVIVCCSAYEINLNSDYDYFEDFTIVSNDDNESDVSMTEYEDRFDDDNDLKIIRSYCYHHNSNSNPDYDLKYDSNDFDEINSIIVPVMDNDAISNLYDKFTEVIINVNANYTTPNSSLINYNSNQTFCELVSYDRTDHD